MIQIGDRVRSTRDNRLIGTIIGEGHNDGGFITDDEDLRGVEPPPPHDVWLVALDTPLRHLEKHGPFWQVQVLVMNQDYVEKIT